MKHIKTVNIHKLSRIHRALSAEFPADWLEAEFPEVVASAIHEIRESRIELARLRDLSNGPCSDCPKKMSGQWKDVTHELVVLLRVPQD